MSDSNRHWAAILSSCPRTFRGRLQLENASATRLRADLVELFDDLLNRCDLVCAAGNDEPIRNGIREDQRSGNGKNGVFLYFLLIKGSNSLGPTQWLLRMSD